MVSRLSSLLTLLGTNALEYFKTVIKGALEFWELLTGRPRELVS